MSKLISGTHHAAIKCKDEQQFLETIAFYRDVLGLSLLRTWGEGEKSGAMLDTGNSILELFADGQCQHPKGVWAHIALETGDVDACIQAVRDAGYPIIVEPKDIVISSQPPYPARIAFCVGAAGEEIEFFCPKE
ncbi:MAG: VOC family protein [Oscillospiraceae bacterium]|nr:VOC family protein [Oscillospiraceae bacterium]